MRIFQSFSPSLFTRAYVRWPVRLLVAAPLSGLRPPRRSGVDSIATCHSEASSGVELTATLSTLGDTSREEPEADASHVHPCERSTNERHVEMWHVRSWHDHPAASLQRHRFTPSDESGDQPAQEDGPRGNDRRWGLSVYVRRVCHWHVLIVSLIVCLNFSGALPPIRPHRSSP